MKILLALKQIDFAAKLFAAASFSTFEAAFQAKDENALKAHLDAAVAAVPAKEKIVEKQIEPSAEQLQTLVTAELRAQLVGLGISLKADENPIDGLKAALAANAAAGAQLSVVNAGLVKSGITLKASDEAKGVQESDVIAAVDNRISLKAAELNGRLGTPAVDPSLNNNPAAAPKGEKSELKGLARVQASFEAESARAKARRN